MSQICPRPVESLRHHHVLHPSLLGAGDEVKSWRKAAPCPCRTPKLRYIWVSKQKRILLTDSCVWGHSQVRKQVRPQRLGKASRRRWGGGHSLAGGWEERSHGMLGGGTGAECAGWGTVGLRWAEEETLARSWEKTQAPTGPIHMIQSHGLTRQQWGVQEETDSEKTNTEIFLKETDSESRHQPWALSPRGLGTDVQWAPPRFKPTVGEAGSSRGASGWLTLPDSSFQVSTELRTEHSPAPPPSRTESLRVDGAPIPDLQG